MSRKASAPAAGSAAPAAPTPSATYEQTRDELARVVAALESGGLGLEESLTLWERGEALARQCTAFLEGARERVETALAAADGDLDDADTDDPDTHDDNDADTDDDGDPEEG